MSNTNHTLIVMLLDASGSMSTLKTGAVTGINQFIEQQKNAAALITGDRRISLTDDLSDQVSQLTCSLTLIQFNGSNNCYLNNLHSIGTLSSIPGASSILPNGEPKGYHYDYRVIHNNKPIQEVPVFTENDYPCGGGTPLIDAYCKCIDDTNHALSLIAEDQKPGRVIFVVMTDGEENDSRKFKKADLSERLKTYQDTKNWQFVYLGANQDAIQEANSVGTAAANSITYHNSNAGLLSAFEDTSDMILRKRSVSDHAMTNVMYSASAYTKQDAALGSAMNMQHVGSVVGAAGGTAVNPNDLVKLVNTTTTTMKDNQP